MNGRVTPLDGARRICTHAFGNAKPAQAKQLARFKVLLHHREWEPDRSDEDHAEIVSAVDAEIVSGARRLFNQGGLAITE